MFSKRNTRFCTQTSKGLVAQRKSSGVACRRLRVRIPPRPPKMSIMKIDKLNPYERKETTAEIVLIKIWDDLDNIRNDGLLTCEYCKKILKYLDVRFD